MKHYNHILFPVALTQQSPLIGKRAAKIAEQAEAKLSLIHVVEPRRRYGVLEESSDEVDKKLIEAKRQQLAELGKALSVPEKDQYLKVGSPKLNILDLAKQIEPELILVASAARSGYAHLLGSTAVAVVHSAPCDVLTIRVGESVGPVIQDYHRALFPTALVDHSAMVAQRAAAFAESVHAELSILHVIDPVPGYGFGVVTSEEIETARENQALKRMKEMTAGINIPDQDLYVKGGSPKSVILETASELAADIIVIASHGEHGVAHLLGSTAIAVVHSAKCDVLTVRIKETTVMAAGSVWS